MNTQHKRYCVALSASFVSALLIVFVTTASVSHAQDLRLTIKWRSDEGSL